MPVVVGVGANGGKGLHVMHMIGIREHVSSENREK